jgi:hypothetical protein
MTPPSAFAPDTPQHPPQRRIRFFRRPLLRRDAGLSPLSRTEKSITCGNEKHG